MNGNLSKSVLEKFGKAISTAVRQAIQAGSDFNQDRIHTRPGPNERKILVAAEEEARMAFYRTKDREWLKAAKAIYNVLNPFSTK